MLKNCEAWSIVHTNNMEYRTIVEFDAIPIHTKKTIHIDIVDMPGILFRYLIHGAFVPHLRKKHGDAR